jgi:DNA-binding NtrC family response regulator
VPVWPGACYRHRVTVLLLTEGGLCPTILFRGQREGPTNQTHAPLQKGKQTILVVDDDASILSLVSALLIDEDYNVLTASTGTKGLQQSRDFKGTIDLLLSDFQMPGMSGVDLATAMTAERPEIKVLLMSGFTGGMLILNEGWHFLDKPFVASQLRALVVGLVSPNRKSRFVA